jgi:hypothetical protein
VPLEPSSAEEQEQQWRSTVAMPDLPRPKESWRFYQGEAMKEEWLMSGAAVPVDAETTQALVEQIKKMINTIGDLMLSQERERAESQGRIETLHAMYELASKQRDQLMDEQRSQIAAMRGRMQ